MITFNVTLKRVSYSNVSIEAASASELRLFLTENPDVAYDHFTSSEETWHDGEIKIKSIKKANAK
ncbi:MAG: hypothetical protein H7255_20760 [Ramlibacter sp.]|nr:hypothetical protein [Ramlibacter sp.]